jgi:hypothetical protein
MSLRQEYTAGRIRILDALLASLSFAAAALSAVFLSGWRRGLLAAVFLLISVAALTRAIRAKTARGAAPKESDAHLVQLLDENGNGIADWDLLDRTGVVIGRSSREMSVDIDLTRSAYDALIEEEHAVLNFSGGSWYVEDVSAKNGMELLRRGKTYGLAKGAPCMLVSGDIMCLAGARLKFI